MANGISSKAQALSPNRLAQLCVSAGGDEGCGSGDRSQILGIIDNRLEVIGDEQLASLCLSTGANGCGGGSVPGSNVPVNGAPNGANQIVAGMSNSEVVAYKKRCVNVLRSPQRYESDIVGLCRLIKRQ